MKLSNMPDLSTRPFHLSVERLMEAGPNMIFLAWTKQFEHWFAAPGSFITQGEVNTVFFFETEFENKRHPHYGRFLKLEKDRLIEITWVTGEGGTKGAETVVRVELAPTENGTLLHLTHSGFPDEESRNQHEQAWPMVLEQLDIHLNKIMK